MAYNLPMIDAPSDLTKGFTQGSNLYNMLMQHAIQKAQNKRAEAANARAEKTSSRMEGLYPYQLQKLQNELNPDYEFNKISRMYDLSKQKFANQDEEQKDEESPEKAELLKQQILIYGIINEKLQTVSTNKLTKKKKK